MSYTVRNVTIAVAPVLRFMGHKFRVHRPVERDGQRRRRGWQLSLDGEVLSFTEENVDDPIAYFKDKLEKHFVNGEVLEQALEYVRGTGGPP